MNTELVQPEAQVRPPSRLGWRLLCLALFAALMGGVAEPLPFLVRMLMATTAFLFLLEFLGLEPPRSRIFPPPYPKWRFLGSLVFGLLMAWRLGLNSPGERAAVAGLAMALGMALALRGLRKSQGR
jgi:hypothetical protein